MKPVLTDHSLKLQCQENMVFQDGSLIPMISQDRFYCSDGNYSGPCILRPPLQPDKYGIKLEVVFKLRNIYIENIMVSLIASLKCRDHCSNMFLQIWHIITSHRTEKNV